MAAVTGPFDRRINRRGALFGAGSVGLGALLAACGADGEETATVETTSGATATVQPRSGEDLTALFGRDSACTLTPEETEGPYYFDPNAIRSDLREDRQGVPLRLALRVRDAAACAPISNAVVEIWHCDAGGVYSGFESASQGAGAPPGGPGAPPSGGGPGAGPSDDHRYLRGAQVSDAAGIVQFETIYPGWYAGRTVHIHAKVHVDNATVLTTQLFFDDATSAAVFERPPYSSRSGRDSFNADDSIFDPSLLVPLSAQGKGYLGAISFDVETA